jgi:hydrogenase expression/formation protein HypC
MCLGIPGKVIEIEEVGGFLRGKVEITGVIKEVSLDFVPEVKVGDYVLVHAGYANTIIDEREAEETMKLLEAVTNPFNQGV